MTAPSTALGRRKPVCYAEIRGEATTSGADGREYPGYPDGMIRVTADRVPGR